MQSCSRYAVIGNPIAHSLSPVMQSAAFLAAGINARYEAIRLTSEELPAWLLGARAGFAGFNVTIPHKEDVSRSVDVVDDLARSLGAVNTVAVKEGALIGWNTDVPGFKASLQELSHDVAGKGTVVFGAGGSARAVVWSLLDMDARVTLIARTVSRARTLLHVIAGARGDSALQSQAHVLAADHPTVCAVVEEATLLVNTTPLGMSHLPGNPLPVGVSLQHRPAVIDLIYGHETPLLQEAREAGCLTLDGIEMLVQQGAASFRLWTETEPDIRARRQACRTSLGEK